MFKKYGKWILFSVSVLILAVVYFIYNIYVLDIQDDISRYYWKINMSTFAFISLFFSISTLILLPSNNSVFVLWIRYILSWYVPLVTVIMISAKSTGAGIFPDRVDVSILFGWILVIVTLIFTLIQKFWYKR